MAAIVPSMVLFMPPHRNHLDYRIDRVTAPWHVEVQALEEAEVGENHCNKERMKSFRLSVLRRLSATYEQIAAVLVKKHKL